MSAREELHESMCGSCEGRYARGECESVDRVIDAYAHELAQRIRAGWDETRGATQASKVMAFAADIIDPEAQR